MPVNVQVTTRGEIAEPIKQRAADRIAGLERYTRRTLLEARVVLTHERNPRIERPARAEAELDLDGRIVRARVAEPAMAAAVDELADRLRRQIARIDDERLERRRNVAETPAGAWRGGDWAPGEPPLRAPGERELVRRKTFAIDPLSPQEAILEMHDLDHAFYLFRDAQSGRDALVYHRDDGRIGLIADGEAAGAGETDGGEAELVREPSRYSDPLTLEAAISKMDAVGHRFLFFEDADSGRGNVLYLRHDGHYGLIQPAP
jgi:ribosomal subunit interface protein